MAGENAGKLAVSIDTNDTQPFIIEGLLAEVAKYGTAQVNAPAAIGRVRA